VPGAIAQVVLLAGPSGSGKSHVARRSGLPVVCLDDFYRDGDEEDLPRRDGTVDWESPLAWDAAAAVTTLATLCHDGRADIPVYAFGEDRRVGHRMVELGGAPLVVAEGIFAAEIVADCAAIGILAAAYALQRPRFVTYIRRLSRDLAEHRKPPMVLLRRGLVLLRSEPTVLARQSLLGARPASARRILAGISARRRP
jgi:uridine kinase